MERGQCGHPTNYNPNALCFGIKSSGSAYVFIYGQNREVFSLMINQTALSVGDG